MRRAGGLGVLGLLPLLLPAVWGAGAPQAPPVNQHPAWSADGSRIAFASDRSGNVEIYVIDRDGANLLQVTDDPREDSYPSWSPDGEHLLFHSGFGRKLGLYLFHVRTGARRALTEEEFFIEPELSPNGKTVVLSSRHGENLDIHTLDLESGEVTPITSDPALDGFPSWIDERAILFHSSRNGIEEIFRQNLDGSGLERLSTAGVRSMHADWSPNGRSIVFDSERHGDREIYVMKADGSDVRRLTESPGRDGYPRWSPDGRTIAFHSQRSGRYHIHLMNADGAGVSCLTC